MGSVQTKRTQQKHEYHQEEQNPQEIKIDFFFATQISVENSRMKIQLTILLAVIVLTAVSATKARKEGHLSQLVPSAVGAKQALEAGEDCLYSWEPWATQCCKPYECKPAPYSKVCT